MHTSNPAWEDQDSQTNFSPDSDDDFLPTRLDLLDRLKDWSDHESWSDFFNTYREFFYGIARRAGLSDDEAQDVVQESIVSVAKRIQTFQYDPGIGSFKGWLALITRRRIADHWRRRARQPVCQELQEPNITDCETSRQFTDNDTSTRAAEHDAEWGKQLVNTALARVKQQVSQRQYQIFDLYMLKEYPAEDVAETFGVNVGQVYLAKHRVGSLVKKELKQLRNVSP